MPIGGSLAIADRDDLVGVVMTCFWDVVFRISKSQISLMKCQILFWNARAASTSSDVKSSPLRFEPSVKQYVNSAA